MVREIKFRAWDKQKKGIISANSLGLQCWNVLASMMSPENSQFVFMQFTGLKDKNGKEIWEGDVVKLNAVSKGKLGTANKEWITVVAWEEKSASFVLKTNEFSWIFSETDFNGHPFIKEVIGNIYENPELLKP